MAIYGDEEEEDTGDFLKQWGFQKTACQKCNLVLKDNQDFLIQCSKCKNAYYCSSKCFNADIDAHQKQCETGELAHDISSYSFSRKNLPEDKIDGKRKQQKVEDQKQNPPKSTRKKSKPKTEEKEIPPKRKSSPKKTLKKKKKSLPEEKKEPAGKPSDHQDKERGLEMVDKELQTDKEDRLELSNIEIIPGEDDETKDDLNSAIPFSISTKEIDNNDGTELLAVTREALTAENISRMLLRLPPGKIFPCRCASATCARARAQGINDGKSTKRPPRLPPRLPSMCPDCSAGLCWPESEINGTGPTIRTECPDCATIVTVPRIQIEEATHEKAPKKPSRPSKDETSTPMSPPKPPARLPSMCPDCSAGLCWPESEINGTGPTLRMECPDCATTVTVPRIQIEEATHENAPKKPSRPSMDEISTPMSPPKTSARLPCTCPSCKAHICWHDCEVKGTGATMHTVCPECASIIVVPRIQINDATHLNSPKKPTRIDNDMASPRSPPKPPARLPSMCPSCSAGLCWRHSDVNSRERTVSTVCPECDSNIIVPRIQINDATHESAPKRPWREYSDEKMQLPAKCLECNVDLYWPDSEINGSGLTLQTVCADCAAIITVPRIQNNGPTDDNAPKKPCRCLEHDCCPIIKDGGTVTTQSESLTEESIYSESSRSQSRVSQNNGPVSPLKIGDIVGPRPRANPCRCSVHGGDCPHVLLAEAKARGGPPRMPVRCGGCEGFMTWPRETIGKAKPFADNTKLRGEDLTGCTLQVPYLSDRCQDDSLTDSEGSESSEYSKPILEFRLKCTMKESDDQESNHPGDESSRQWTLGVKKLNYSPSVRTYECDTSSQASTGQFSIDLRTAEIQKHELLSYRPEWATNPQLRRTLSLNQATRTPGKDQPEWTKMANIKQKNFVEVLQSDGVEKKKTVLPSTPEWVINPPIKKRTTNRRVSPVHKKGSQQLSTKPTIVLEP